MTGWHTYSAGCISAYDFEASLVAVRFFEGGGGLNF